MGTITRMRVVAVALASLLLAACTGSEAGGPPPEEQGPFAYRLDVSLELPQAAQGASGKERAEYTTWVAPSTGAWRSEGEDTSGFLQTHVYAGDATMSAIEGHPQSLSVRVGSPDFLGSNAGLDVVELVRGRGELDVGDEIVSRCLDTVECTYVVAERIPLAEAERRGLFAIPVDEADWLERELDPGQAAQLDVAAYWFGPTLAGREAFVAREHRSADETVHITCYGDPAEIAAGKSHCVPEAAGLPSRELQVVSRSLTDDLARREVARLERHADGRPIRLANGEEAVLYLRAILTETTLVTFVGQIDLAAHAAQLRAL
jgi:hypothetical protein